MTIRSFLHGGRQGRTGRELLMLLAKKKTMYVRHRLRQIRIVAATQARRKPLDPRPDIEICVMIAL